MSVIKEKMPIIKSAKKRLKQSEKRRILNLGYKRRMKKIIKEIRELVAEGKKKDAAKLIPKANKVIDKAAKRGIIKENTASRKKSRLTKSTN
jgi:small subunit ribosomal protein S20